MTITQDRELDYYLVGSKEDIVISNSLMTAINPLQGGSPRKALSFIEKQLEAKETRSIENGKILHAYNENPKEFGISEVVRPSETLGNLVDEFFKLKKSGVDLSDVSLEITSNLKTESGKSADILAAKAAYEGLAIRLGLPIEQTMRLMKKARKNVDAYVTYKEATLVEMFTSKCLDYLKELEKLQNKVMLTAADKFIIESAIKSLRAKPLINSHLGLSNTDADRYILIKEVDLYFTIGPKASKCKIRVDCICIDLVEKVIYIYDLKTTSKPLGYFQNTIENYRYYRQLHFYKMGVARSLKYLQELILSKLMLSLNLEEFRISCHIAAVETTGDFESCIFNIDDYQDKAKSEIIDLVIRLEYHKETGNWVDFMEEANGYITIKVQ